MTKYVHIVQVHPVENGAPNLYKVVKEMEYSYLESAQAVVQHYNETATMTQAVYLGRVNDATGELE